MAGTAVAAMRISPVPPLRWVGAAYVETVRSTPLTVVFFFAAFVLPQLDIVFSYFTFAVIALSVYHTAFVCEAVRSGVNGVDPGQAEAARAIGLTFGQSLRLVILPQAFRNVIQPLGTVGIALTKNSSIASAFGVEELTGATYRLATANPDAVIAALLGGIVGYLALTMPAAALLGLAERKVAGSRTDSGSRPARRLARRRGKRTGGPRSQTAATTRTRPGSGPRAGSR